MIKNKDLESLVGQMADAIKDSGKMANSREKALTKTNKEYKKAVCGWMEKR
jgi:hypothetical protein